MDLALIPSWGDVMGSQGCRRVKGAVHIVDHGARISREDHHLKNRLVDGRNRKSQSLKDG